MFLAFPSFTWADTGDRPPERERPLRLDHGDRRRLALASVLTIAALPAVWLVNRDDTASRRPNVAAVGAAVDDAADAAAIARHRSTRWATCSRSSSIAAHRAAPAATEPVVPVVGTGEGEVLATATAIFRRSLRDAGTCLFTGVPSGTPIVVVNVANDRSVECWTALRRPGEPPDELVMSAAAFAAIADPTTAPIHVEIRQR